MRGKIIDLLIVLCLIGIVVLMFRIGYITNHMQDKEKYKITAITQSSGRVRYFKEVDSEQVNIDKLELEDLMKRYDIVVEVDKGE